MFIKLFLLSVIQGITEFLPISSSGHLVLFSYLLSMNQTGFFLFILVVHAGTALAAVYYFREQIIYIIQGLWKKLIKKEDNQQTYESSRWLGMILMVSFPTVIIALFIKSYTDIISTNPLYIGVGLIVTGIILLMTKFLHYKNLDLNKFHYWKAFLVGLAQGFAVLPGISRSGSTIAVALILGASPLFAGTLSFMASFVVIFGGLILEFKDYFLTTDQLPLMYLFMSFIVSAVSGFLSLTFLMKILKKGRIYLFSGYCFCLGFLIIVYYLFKQ